MSYTKHITIWCDGVMPDGYGCSSWHDGQGGSTMGDTATAGQARRLGRESGWSYRGGRDLCPECTEEATGSTAQCPKCGVVVTDQTPSTFYTGHDERCGGELHEPSEREPGGSR